MNARKRKIAEAVQRGVDKIMDEAVEIAAENVAYEYKMDPEDVELIYNKWLGKYYE